MFQPGSREQILQILKGSDEDLNFATSRTTNFQVQCFLFFNL